MKFLTATLLAGLTALLLGGSSGIAVRAVAFFFGLCCATSFALAALGKA